MKIDEKALRTVLESMPDGFVFEKFANKILSIVLGDEFIPVGGTKDRGIDGFKHIYSRKIFEKFIYQISTEEVHWKQDESKITTTQDKLIKNKIELDKLFFVTNRKVEKKDSIEDSFYAKYKTPLTIYDQEWFVTNIIAEPRAYIAYTSFAEIHVHEYTKATKFIEVAEFSGDPRLYVFLRQHVDEINSEEIESNILDGLILYALEGTGSEKGIFMTVNEIIKAVKGFSKINLVDIELKIKDRLFLLSQKPERRIKHHKVDGKYCLPYTTRLLLAERDINDNKLHLDFTRESGEILSINLKQFNLTLKDEYSVFENILHNIYYHQGLEFADFILNDVNKESVDDTLSSIVAKVVDDSSIIKENKSKVKTAFLITIREIAYNGTETQREFLRRLSKTYMLIFLTQNDPKISLFFKTLANKLEVFVCTSIIIPALSEYNLNNENKRYWNLLKGARIAGVKLFINEYIVDELVSHFQGVKNTYESYYRNNEKDYLEDEISILYIDEILIRAYFYAKKRGQISDFNSFLYKFVNPSLSNLREDIIFFLKETFDIEYITTASQNIVLDQTEVDALVEHLKAKKQNSKKRAEVDAKLILHIYKIREKNNETNSSGIFGYKTWWLSQDINTYKSVQEVLGLKYTVSCYMRTDFIYKYISLSPKKEDIDLLYKKCFPSLLGVNLSYHIPQGISEFVSQMISEHKDTSPQIVRRILKNLTEKLMSSMESISTKEFKTFFDEELDKITKA